nr:unnamed protein product [Digitaria exilis]
MFDRTANLANNQIINYRCDPAEKWLVLIGIAPGAPERPQLVKGNMQLFSVDQQRSQALEAHAASFATFKNLPQLVDFTPSTEEGRLCKDSRNCLHKRNTRKQLSWLQNLLKAS